MNFAIFHCTLENYKTLLFVASGVDVNIVSSEACKSKIDPLSCSILDPLSRLILCCRAQHLILLRQTRAVITTITTNKAEPSAMLNQKVRGFSVDDKK